jgi:hypothetical protein
VFSVENRAVKERLGGWCEIAASLGASQLRVEFYTGGCEDRIRAREDEESLLLVAVAKERLVKTQQAGKRFSGCCGDL